MEKQLEPHQQRVVDEQAELQIKINSLDAFINQHEVFMKLLSEERNDLKAQLLYMTEYNNILKNRINRF